MVTENEDGNVVVIVSGGINEDAVLNSCEQYDISTDKWTPFPSMKEKRVQHQVPPFTTARLLKKPFELHT